ncbi:MAG: hypothetical protein KDC92_00925 [Bacteroidetes bacterium]|nr:hypothetical protein [Bacteroidota bacterium]
MSQNELIPLTAKLIKTDFRLTEDDSFPTSVVSRGELLQALAERIAYLLDHDFEFLMQALYRIDVNENKVKMALQGESDNPAQILAELIIEREMQKAETRRKYANGLFSNL